MKLLALPLLATAVTHVLGTHVQAHPSSRSIYGSFSPSAKKVFDESMDLNEKLWDEAEGYLYALDSSGIHDTRASAMYATALLARAGGNGADVARAVRIIDAVAGEQYDINGTLWFGTYPHTPQDPFPGTSLLGAVPYASYDPNWRDFVATAWVLALEESRSLLSNDTVATLEQSLLKAGKGILLRYQGRGPYANSVAVNTSVDNADAAYTNPWLMGTLVMSYIGHRLNDTQLIKKSNEDAQAVYNLFTFGGFNTFSEYNSATYTGVDLWALSLWITYGPKGTKLKEYGSYMLNHTLLDLADLYHADLRNLAGPWDRSYGFDMTRYHSIFGEVVTALAPLGKGAIPSPPASGLHLNDASCFGPLIPLVADMLKNAAPPGVLESFSAFRKERTVARKVRTNVVDETAVRNFTAWLGANISIGGMSLDEPSPRQASNVAGVIQWLLPSSLYSPNAASLPKIGYIAVTPPMAGTINVTATPHTLTVAFPPSARWTNNTLPGLVSFAVGGFDMRRSGADMTKGLVAAPGLNVTVDTVGMGNQSTTYNQDGWNDFYFFNVSYPITAQWPAVPSVTITVH